MPYTRLNMFSGSSVDGRIYQNTIIYEAIVGTCDGFYYEFSMSAGSPYARLTLDYTGMLRSLSWNNNSSWTTTAEDPSSSCDLYDSCGPFGYCDNMGVFATCRCLDGFEPIGLNFSSGCRRTKALECSRQSFRDLVWDEVKVLGLDKGARNTGKYSNHGENLYVRLADSPDNPDDRPLMSSVIFILENESALLPAPKQPAYFALQNWETQEPRENMENSANGVVVLYAKRLAIGELI
ncbi:hypothetical protein ACQ4PT_062821 [Festuca glaucescens]